MHSSTPIGPQLSNLEFPSVAGSRVTIADYRGKRLLIFVWASW